MECELTISIIIPIYNVELYIQRCIESVMNQDKVNADLECILVDDCTPDRSMEIVKEMITSYSGSIHFILLRHEQNRGLSAARNTGLKQAIGDYVIFVDSDDWLNPGSIQCFIEGLQYYPHSDIVIGNARDCNRMVNMLNPVQKTLYLDNKSDIMWKYLHNNIYVTAWNKLVKRSVIVENRIQFIEGIIHEDIPWGYQVFSNVSSVLLLSQVTYTYEYVPSSIMNSPLTHEKVDVVVQSYTKGLAYIIDNPPVKYGHKKDLITDYILYLVDIFMIVLGVMSRGKVSETVSRDFYSLRNHFVNRVLREKRLFLFFFMLILYFPFSKLQQFKFFRHNYYVIVRVINRLSHMTDFLH